MYDIKPLEEDWKKYRKKKLKPWYILIFSIVIILIISMIVFNNKEAYIVAFEASADKNKVVSAEENTSKSDSTIQVAKNTKSSVLLNRALDTLEEKEKEVPIVEEDISVDSPVDMISDIPILQEKRQMITSEEEEMVDMPRKKMHLNIIETSSITAYEDVEKRFLQSHDVDDSLFLAKAYYDKGNYRKAEYWSLQTNKLDGNIEESLFIFVKSKFKLGQRNEAIRILTTYIKKSNSSEAISLLTRMKNGRL